MTKQREKAARVLNAIEIGDYILLNDEKLGRVFAKLGDDASQEQIMAEYDRLGGGIKTKDGRKIMMGTFWNFELNAPQKEVVIKEDDFEDEYKLVRKVKAVKRERGQDVRQKVARLKKTAQTKKEK